MNANYHTHTWRCNHAYGREQDYVEKAIEAGMKVLGFSDHTPYNFPNNYISRNRMMPSQLEGYVDTVLRLRSIYKNEIDILLGLEIEYYPDLWGDLLSFLNIYPFDYFLLGQHYISNEYDNPIYCGRPTNSATRLRLYCNQCIEALSKANFLYFAHPDLFNYTGRIDIYIYEMRRLCRFCKEHDVPLEVNMLGIRESRNYPNPIFWEIASEEGNRIVFGADAHYPHHVFQSDVIDEAYKIIQKSGIPTTRLSDILLSYRNDCKCDYD